MRKPFALRHSIDYQVHTARHRTVTISSREYARLLRAERHATTDDLTGTLTRYALRELFTQLSRQFESGRQPAFGLVLIDLQGFKRINDRRGQKRGDEVLANFGAQLRASVKRTDTVARIGGDEFLIVLRGISDEPTLRRVMKRLEGPYTFQVGRRRTKLGAYVVGRVATRQNLDQLESVVCRLLVQAKRLHKSQVSKQSRGSCEGGTRTVPSKIQDSPDLSRVVLAPA